MKSKLIPVFPLDIVVFPGESIPLHIFESQYQELLRVVEDGTFDTFGINTVLNGTLQPIGTEVKISQIKNYYADGRRDIEVRGIGRYLLEQYDKEMPGYEFPGGRVIELSEPEMQEDFDGEELKSQISELFTLLNIRERMPIQSLPFYSFTWAPFIGLPVEKRYQLLKSNDEKQRRVMIRQHVDQVLPVLRETERIKEKVSSNGHFSELRPEV
jgi:ATP-dependent Lon protease